MPTSKSSLPLNQQVVKYFLAALGAVFALITLMTIYVSKVEINVLPLALIFGIVSLAVVLAWTLESTSLQFHHLMRFLRGEYENATRAYLISLFLIVSLIIISIFMGTTGLTPSGLEVQFSGPYSYAPVVLLLLGAVVLRQNLGRTTYLNIYLSVRPDENLSSASAAWPEGHIYYPTDWWSVGIGLFLFASASYILFLILASRLDVKTTALGIIETITIVILAYLMFEPLHRKMREYEQLSPQLNAESLRPYISAGKIVAPKTVAVGESCVITAEVSPSNDIKKYPAPVLEMELRSAAGTIEGDKNLRVPLDKLKFDVARYCWNCEFATSGNKIINMLVRLSEASNPPLEYPIKCIIKVKSTASQFWPPILAIVLAAITIVLQLDPQFYTNLAHLFQ